MAGLLIVASFLVARIGDEGAAPVAADALMLAAAVVSGWKILRTAWTALRARVIGIDLLVSIATIGAVALGEYWEAAAVTFLFSVGHALEQGAMARTRAALTDLVDSAPEEAIVLDTAQDGALGEPHIVPVGQVRVGDTVLVRTGTPVPVDGTVSDGRGAVDEATVTGEPLPAEKTAGSTVHAGTVLVEGLLQVRADQVGADTLLARIVRRVEDAQDARGRAETFIERFSRWYTPAIVVLAVLVGALTRDLTLALTLLVIGCPGALVVSIPVATVAGIGRGARDGILIRGGEHLETAARVDTVVLDKTGTLTLGVPALTDIRTVGTASSMEVLETAALAEVGAHHPLGAPILDAARTCVGGDAEFPAPRSIDVIPGRGLRAVLRDGSRVAVGTVALAHQAAPSDPIGIDEAARLADGLARRGRTPVVVVREGAVLGVLGVADRARPDAGQAIRGLRAAGISQVIMLSGDRPEVASAVGDELGIEDARGGLLPEDKLAAVTRLQEAGRTVAMVGDGVNDAPALARADVGVAMGAAGSSLALEVSDIALMSDRLDRLPRALRLARQTRAVMRENVVLAVATVALLLLGVLAGGVTMAVGMLVHEASVLIVVLNATRLLARPRAPRPVPEGAGRRPAESHSPGGPLSDITPSLCHSTGGSQRQLTRHVSDRPVE